MNIQEAFKEQAKSDFDVYGKLNRMRINECHQIHYLIMACEKLSKSFVSYGNTHYVMKSFIQNCDNLPDIRSYLGFSKNREAFLNRKKQLLRVADQFETWIPKNIKKSEDSKDVMTAKNTEYPFEYPLGSGNYVAPHNQRFDEISATDLKAMINFIDQMISYKRAT